MADEPGAPAPTIPASPWQQDIMATFPDPAVAAQVDNFLRARVQPRVTQLEQQYAATEEARQLWESFHQDPEGTFNAVRDQLVSLGYSVGQATQMATDAQVQAAQQPAPAAPMQTAAAQTEDPRLAEMYADWTRQRELAAYDAAIEQIVNDPANADINPNRLHIYVAAADGDFDQALVMYRADIANVLMSYGVDPTTATPQQVDAAADVAQQAQVAAAAPGAPPVMGGGAGAPVPTTPDYRAEGLSPQQALHKSIEDAAAMMLRSGAAPPVA
jgi:hypothetical protein